MDKRGIESETLIRWLIGVAVLAMVAIGLAVHYSPTLNSLVQRALETLRFS